MNYRFILAAASLAAVPAIAFSPAWPSPPSCLPSQRTLLNNTWYTNETVSSFDMNWSSEMYLVVPATFDNGDPLPRGSLMTVYLLTTLVPSTAQRTGMGISVCVGYSTGSSCEHPLSSARSDLLPVSSEPQTTYVQLASERTLSYPGMHFIAVAETEPLVWEDMPLVAMYRRVGSPRNLPISQVVQANRAAADWIGLVCIDIPPPNDVVQTSPLETPLPSPTGTPCQFACGVELSASTSSQPSSFGVTFSALVAGIAWLFA
jgi:hypothetical protein